jgi:hypothetical protein
MPVADRIHRTLSRSGKACLATGALKYSEVPTSMLTCPFPYFPQSAFAKRSPKAAWYGILCYTSSLVFTRVSILLLYRRIFSSSSKMKKAILVVMVLVLAVSIWLVATVFTVCVPLQAFWDWTLGSKKLVYCHPGSMYWFNSALHIASDLVIIALPLPILWKMRLPRRQKIALVGVFALGFL